MPSFRYSPYAGLLFANGLLALVVAGLAFRRRRQRTARLLAGMALAVAWWSLCYGLHVAGDDFATQYLFNRWKYLGTVWVAPLWFLLAYTYTHAPRDLTRRQQTLVLASTAVFLPLVLLDPYGHTWWPRLWTERLPDSGLLVTHSTHSVFYFLYLGLTFFWLLAGLYLYLRHYLASPGHERQRVRWMILAGLVPAVANLFTQFGFSPLPWGLDPFLFSLTALFVALAVLRHRFLDTLPIARRLIITQLPDGVIVVDTQLRVVDLNPQAAALCQTPATQAVGQPLERVIRDVFLKEQVLHALHDAGQQEQEIDLPTHRRTLLLRLTPIQVGAETLGQIITLTDITQRKQLESELAKARDMAVVASALKSRLLATASQDMRHPIGMVMGYLESLLQGVYGPLSSEQQQVLTQALQQSNQVIEFLSNLMGYAELESGSLMLQPTVFPAHSLVERVRPITETLAAAKGLQTHWEVDPDLESLYGDPNWLSRVLYNLLNNALSYTTRGYIRIRLYRPDDTHWAIEVEDSGRGISPQEQQTLFDLQHSRGLGLVVARGLVEQMGGEFRFRSTPGQGSVFTAVLPQP